MIEQSTQDLFISLTVQFGGVTIAVLALTEWLPFMRLFGIGPPYGKRVASVVYAVLLSLLAYEMGLVKLPALEHDIAWLPYVVCVLLGLISMAMAHGAHTVNRMRKEGNGGES